MKNHQVYEANAQLIWHWIQTRGGVAIWESIDLSDLGKSWTTPVNQANGEPATSPSWQAANAPTRIITDPGEIDVVKTLVVKRFHVGIRMGAQGMTLKLTDGATRRVRAAVAKAAENRADNEAWHEFDYGTQEALICVPGEVTPLKDWSESHGNTSKQSNSSEVQGQDPGA